MPYAVLLKEAHTMIDEIPHEKIEYIIRILQETKKLYTPQNDSFIENDNNWLSDVIKMNNNIVVPSDAAKYWNREELYERGF